MADKLTDHPLEEIFGLDQGTTISPVQSVEIEIDEDGDQEESGIDQQLDTIYAHALEAYETQAEMVDQVDPKFMARTAEVAAQYLKIALDSTNSKSNKFINKKKINASRGKMDAPGTVNNNLIVADRNDILKALEGE